jgi:PAS domain S-box-containing protein
MTGFSTDELLGRDAISLVHCEDRTRVTRSVIQVLRATDAEPCEYRVACRDGSSRWVLGSVAIVSHEGDAVVGHLVDVTEQRALRNSCGRRHGETPSRACCTRAPSSSSC